ncbi:MAG: hypothetical protein D6731_07790 [Planctomycetota bacterium]|nr:MAG: hypothetical protein D6731_07790 [Planctomycetota bacterium]
MTIFGARARGRLRKRVERDLSGRPGWRLVVQGKWICPFCVSLAAKARDGVPRIEEVLDHLEECPPFAGGEGEERPLQELKRFQEAREVRRRVKAQLVSNPSWQLIDFSQRWYCPYCGDPTSVTVPRDRKMTEESLQAIVGHVQGCYAYDRGRGKEKPFSHLKAVVRYQNQAKKLAENVRRKLEGDPAWRRKDDQGCWICPYCQEPQAHIDLSSTLLMFENAPGLIAKHLSGACPQFRSGAAPAPLQPPRSDPAQGALPESRARGEESGVLRDEELRPSDDPLGSARWGQVKDPRSTPSGRYRSTLWGKDGAAAGLRGSGGAGTTLRQLEESGEFTLIADSELGSLRTAGGEERDARPSSEERARRVEDWRREIEQQLASVRSGVLDRSGEHELNASRSGDEDTPDAELAAQLDLARRGLELRRIELCGRPPGADFLDVLDLGQGRMAVVAGSVVSEDAEAPLVAAMTRSLIRGNASPKACPSKVLCRTNAQLFAELDGRSLVQVLYALFDLDSHRARLARAGLNAPLLVNPDRGPEPLVLDSEGMVMGIDRGPIFDGSLEVRGLHLEPGDLLVVFTRGVVEARGGAREEFGIYRMHRLAQRYGTHEVAYFVDKFNENFAQHVQQQRAGLQGCVLALRRARSDEA